MPVQATVAVANVSYKLVTLLVGVLVYGNNVGLMAFLGLVIAQGSAMVYVYERQFGGVVQPKQNNNALREQGDEEEGAALVHAASVDTKHRSSDRGAASE